MWFSRYLALIESFVLFNLIKFENVTSHRFARIKITRQNSTIAHRVGLRIHHKERSKARFNFEN